MTIDREIAQKLLHLMQPPEQEFLAFSDYFVKMTLFRWKRLMFISLQTSPQLGDFCTMSAPLS